MNNLFSWASIKLKRVILSTKKFKYQKKSTNSSGMNPFTTFTLFIMINLSALKNISSPSHSSKLTLSINSSDSWTGWIPRRAKFFTQKSIFDLIMLIYHPLNDKIKNNKKIIRIFFRLYFFSKYITFLCLKIKPKTKRKK